MMRKQVLFTVLAFFFILTVPAWGSTAWGAYLDMNPSSYEALLDEEFPITFTANFGSEEVLAVDAQITYDDRVLEVVSVEDGDLFTTGALDTDVSGEIYYAGIIEDAGSFVTGEGELFTVTFRAIAEGTAMISYVCIPGETATDSNIAKNNLNADDIISCSENGASVITVGDSGGSSNPTPTRTSSGSSTTTTTTTTTRLPESGIVEDLQKIAVPGAILIAIGIVAKLLIVL